MRQRLAILLALATASSLFFTPIDVEARGGRGGGGRGGGGRSVGGGAREGGGAYRGGQTMNRTPTMSRASSKSLATSARQRPQARPSAAQGRIQQSRVTSKQRPSSANRAELRSQINSYAQNRPVKNIDKQALANRTQNFSNKRNPQALQNRQLSERVSQRLKETRPNSTQWFDRNFFDRNNLDLDYVGRGANLWRPATWAALATWGSWGSQLLKII